MEWKKKKQLMINRLREETARPVCLALSGGVDSGLLAALIGKYAKENHTRAYAVTFDTVLHPRADLKAAAQTAKECGLDHYVIYVDELENEKIRKNPENRCYLCKKMMFTKLIEFSKVHETEIVFEGTNYDDTKEYRPGIKAVQELGISSPLKEYGFTKEEVRRWAGELGISSAERPSSPCMATRLPYGTALDEKLLSKIEKGEEQIRELGFSIVRVRVHNDIARIEIGENEILNGIKKRDKIVQILKGLGFTYVTLDLEGFRSGSMDIHIGKEAGPVF